MRLHLLLAGVVLSAIGCATGPRSRPVAWDALPVAKGGGGPGPAGLSARVERDTLLLQGQPLRTARVYAAPVTVTCELMLEARQTPEGGFAVALVPATTGRGQPADLALRCRLGYREPGAESGRDGLTVENRGKPVWEEQSFRLEAGHWYHLQLQFDADRVAVKIDERDYTAAGFKLALSEFKIELNGGQPGNRWRVRNLVIR